MPEPQDEIRAIEERYVGRKQIPEASLYNFPDAVMSQAKALPIGLGRFSLPGR